MVNYSVELLLNSYCFGCQRKDRTLFASQETMRDTEDRWEKGEGSHFVLIAQWGVLLILITEQLECHELAACHKTFITTSKRLLFTLACCCCCCSLLQGMILLAYTHWDSTSLPLMNGEGRFSVFETKSIQFQGKSFKKLWLSFLCLCDPLLTVVVIHYVLKKPLEPSPLTVRSAVLILSVDGDTSGIAFGLIRLKQEEHRTVLTAEKEDQLMLFSAWKWETERERDHVGHSVAQKWLLNVSLLASRSGWKVVKCLLALVRYQETEQCARSSIDR